MAQTSHVIDWTHSNAGRHDFVCHIKKSDYLFQLFIIQYSYVNSDYLKIIRLVCSPWLTMVAHYLNKTKPGLQPHSPYNIQSFIRKSIPLSDTSVLVN